MTKYIASLVGLILLFVAATLLQPSHLSAVTASFNKTVRVVDSVGNVLGGVASGTTASYNETVQVVDATGHVLNSFGAANSGIGGTVASTPGTDNVVNVLNYGAKGDGQFFVNGAMDNNSTFNLTDTTNAPFLSTDCTAGTGCTGTVNKIICVDGAGAAGVETCGVINAFTSSSVVGLSFKNTSGGAISSKEYRYATDDSTAIANAIAALTLGGEVWFPVGRYGLASAVSIPTNVGINLVGAGNRNYLTYTGNSLSKIGTTLMCLTKALGTGFIRFEGVSGTSVQGEHDSIQDMAFVAGAGVHYDGCGSHGITVLNWADLEMDRVQVDGFAGAGVYNDLLGSTNNDFTSSIFIHNSVIAENVTGIQIGTGTFSGFLQNIGVYDTHIQYNQHWGVYMQAPGVRVTDWINNVIQHNDNANNTSYGDVRIDAETAPQGCMWMGNYIESDHTNENAISYATGFGAGPYVGCSFLNNYILGVGTPTNGVTLGGTGNGNAINGITFANNTITGFTNALVNDNLVNSQQYGNKGFAGASTGPAQAAIWSGSTASVLATTKDYISFGEDPGVTAIATQANAQNAMPFAGSVSNLQCKVTTAAGATGDSFAVEKNGSATTLTCTVTNTNTSCSDTTDHPTFATSDLLDIVVNSAATNTNATGVASCGFMVNG